jgi:translation initiation factor IF-2
MVLASDIPFAGLIYAFNVSLPPKVKELAKQRGVTIKNHNVIYKLVDDIKEEITKRLPTKQVEESLGSCLKKISECSSHNLFCR